MKDVERLWVDPRDWEDELSLETTGLAPSLRKDPEHENDRKSALEPLPEISFSIFCTDSSHEFEEWLFQITVCYVRGQAGVPIFVQSKDIRGQLTRPLIRDQELLASRELGESKLFDPNSEQHLTQKAHDHLVRTGQWRDKVNMECLCGIKIPLKNIHTFMSFVKVALDEGIDQKFGYVPLALFGQPKPLPN